MRNTLPISLGAALILFVAAACGPGTPPPPPEPDPDSLAEAQRVQDSIDAARAAREDSLRRDRERLEAERRAAEAERARIAAETARVVEALSMTVHFDYDRASIRADDQATLDTKVAILQANPMLTIQITGHCDERGSDEYNLALGNRRALSAKQYLIDRGIDESRITVSSMGEEQPLALGQDEVSWAQNRRDEFAVMSGGTELRMPSMM